MGAPGQTARRESRDSSQSRCGSLRGPEYSQCSGVRENKLTGRTIIRKERRRSGLLLFPLSVSQRFTQLAHEFGLVPRIDVLRISFPRSDWAITLLDRPWP